MGWLSRFLKRRRQSDRVKIMFLFFIVGIGFLGDAVYRGIQLYQTVKSPIEYVLSNTAGEVTDAQIAKIRELDDVKAVSRQQETVVTLSNPQAEIVVTCVQLSKDYLETVYGTEESGAMKVFYLNPTAWEQMMQKEDVQMPQAESAGDLHMNYILAGEERKEPEEGTAKVVLIEEGLPDDHSYAFCETSGANLQRRVTSVRVQVERQDLEGMNLAHLNSLGLEIANAEDVEQSALIQEMVLLRMKYDCLIVVLCFLSLFFLYFNRTFW